MFRWSKIPEETKPKIIADICDDRLYTFIVQDGNFKKITRKRALRLVNSGRMPITTNAHREPWGHGAGSSWVGCYVYKDIFKKLIDNNVPCTLMHKVKNEWSPEIDTVVCFMTGDTLDVFLVHPKDLIEWTSSDV